MTQNCTQLTSVRGYIPKERMIFSEPISGEIPDSKPKIEFKRINISTRNEDGRRVNSLFPPDVCIHSEYPKILVKKQV